MGAEPPSPWSRWDAPGVTYNPPPLINRPFGDPGPNGNGINGNGPLSQPFIQNTSPPRYVQGYLTRQEDDPFDRDFLRCYYGDPNNPRVPEILESCQRSVGCCTTACCEDTSWEVKYAWAIALVVIFGIIVIIAVVVWLVSWFFNRNKDKKQKKELLASSASPSAAQSQISGAYPASVNNGYYPYVGGPSKYNGQFNGPYNGPYNGRF
uniref:CX domain-containing protein n=1 Tax=Plectus sambesii TaxID=2011161 RepID=A0A914X0J4_9BILA